MVASLLLSKPPPHQQHLCRHSQQQHQPRALPSTTTEPLGVPSGAVDEIDNPAKRQPPHCYHNTPGVTAEAATEAEVATPSAEAVKTTKADKDDEEEEEDSGRSTKRRKSVASIHDVEIEDHSTFTYIRILHCCISFSLVNAKTQPQLLTPVHMFLFRLWFIKHCIRLQTTPRCLRFFVNRTPHLHSSPSRTVFLHQCLTKKPHSANHHRKA